MLQGISNEVEPYFGVNKFQLGRLLRARLQQRLRSNAGTGLAPQPSHNCCSFWNHPFLGRCCCITLSKQLPRLITCAQLCCRAADGKLTKGQQPPANEQQAAPDKAAPPAVSEDPHAGFTVAVGNGLFWLLPYVMYWASSTTLHSGMFDNGRLDFDHAKCAALPAPLPSLPPLIRSRECAAHDG
jgi:hypothetical protein